MLRAEILLQANINYEDGLRRFMGDAQLYETVLAAFLAEDLLLRAQAAYEAQDRAQLQAVVHEAKGVSGNVGLDVLYIETKALLQLLRSNDYTDDELSESYQHFATAYQVVSAAIRAALT